ncbi:MAG: ABC transporter, permease protein [Candidatus Woesebacteria bacterium GW2011_GWB1_39_12]|uniref:ABC transporter, permease protein n=1 Tax=Candidatus Woesebacteria bacterium GW2011_GWB1_39_12 TaxID=1618574 RepID=A0A0G0QG94_9BACT|nr:MAG: ABC transporter, permease protein [Candidatus Woesebacteria bacterium GW2011_GWB1_39_12]
MDLQEIISEALSTLTLNKMRTGLAVLGIIIGIGSVIALISLGQGSQKSIENSIQSLGANLLTVIPGGTSSGGIRTAVGTATTLTLSDARVIEEELTDTTVAQVSPEYSARSQVTAGRNNTNTNIVGVEPQYAQIRKIDVSSGTFISEIDLKGLAKVAVLGPTAASDLFGEGIDPTDQSIRVQGQSMRVVGVTVSKGGSGFNNPDDSIYVPLSTAQKQLFGDSSLTSIAVEAKSQDVMTQAQDEIGYLLLEMHKLKDPTSADFSIFSQNDILSTASQVTGTFTALLGGIAAISLLVGGIGIMNIMLVTVTERTREIGLRKALGAKKKIIISQFLIEAIFLTFTGGMVGMVIGIGTSYALSNFFSLPFAISVQSIALAIGVSGAIGILFGWYPARKAASLQPIEALRYE